MIEKLIESIYHITDGDQIYRVVVPNKRDQPITVGLFGKRSMALDCPEHVATPGDAVRWFLKRMLERQQNRTHDFYGQPVRDRTVKINGPANNATIVTGDDNEVPVIPKIDEICATCRHFMPDGDEGIGICCNGAIPTTSESACKINPPKWKLRR